MQYRADLPVADILFGNNDSVFIVVIAASCDILFIYIWSISFCCYSIAV